MNADLVFRRWHRVEVGYVADVSQEHIDSIFRNTQRNNPGDHNLFFTSSRKLQILAVHVFLMVTYKRCFTFLCNIAYIV